MNVIVLGSLACGALIGFGLWLLLIVFLLPAKVSLHEALRLDRSSAAVALLEQEPTQSRTIKGPLSKGVIWVERRLLNWQITTPDADLALIEWTRGKFLLLRVSVVAGAFLLTPVLMAAAALAGVWIGISVPLGLSVLLAGFGWYMVGLTVRSAAAQRRLEMRESLVSYLTLVALYRASGEGMVGALVNAADASDAWSFRRIAARLSASVRGPVDLTPERGLRMLSDELDVGELADVADIATTASLEGAGVFTTLLARADGLRNQMQSDAEANAAARSVRLAMPKVLLVFTGIAFMLYPLMSSIGF